jgi:hypothetical protein
MLKLAEALRCEQFESTPCGSACEEALALRDGETYPWRNLAEGANSELEQARYCLPMDARFQRLTATVVYCPVLMPFRCFWEVEALEFLTATAAATCILMGKASYPAMSLLPVALHRAACVKTAPKVGFLLKQKLECCLGYLLMLMVP